MNSTRPKTSEPFRTLLAFPYLATRTAEEHKCRFPARVVGCQCFNSQLPWGKDGAFGPRKRRKMAVSCLQQDLGRQASGGKGYEACKWQRRFVQRRG